MNKTLTRIALAASLVFCSGWETSYAQEVGDKMPDTKSIKIQETRPWMNYETSVGGMFNIRYEQGMNDGDLTVDAYLACNGKILKVPFGIYLDRTNSVYLDKNMDGIVDGIIKDPKMPISDAAPECP